MLYHIVTVRPLCEFQVADDMRTQDIEPVVPFELRMWRVRGGKERTSRRALLPGYVICGFRRIPNWHALRKIDGVRAPLYMQGAPTIVPARVVADLEDLSQRVACTRATQDAKRLIRAGSGVRVKQGAFAGMQSAVQVIRGSEARIILDIIGRSTPTWVPVSNLEAA